MHYNFDEIIDRRNTNSVKFDLLNFYFGTEDVLPMFVADMDFRTPDFIIDAVKKRAEHPVYGYSFRPDSFNDSIKGCMKRRHEWEIKNGWVAFSPGVMPSVNMCIMAYTNPGDKIIVQPPVYFPFFQAITTNKRQMVYNPLKLVDSRLCMDLDDLKKKIDPEVKMILLCSPHNPGGTLWTKNELEQLAAICLENKILIISDEIHSDLVFKPGKHIPTASISKEIRNITVTCIAPSKTFNTAGLSTSAVIIQHSELFSKYKKMLKQVHVDNGNLFGNLALEAAYTHGDEWLEQCLEYLQHNRDFTIDYIQKNIPQIVPIKPQATYLIWLDCRKLVMTPASLKEFFIKKARVGLSDGAMFGPGGEGFQRLNFACPRAILKEGLEKIEKAVKSL